jgi:conjugal transfer pilus assembly protein TraU
MAECGMLSAGVTPSSSPFWWCLGCWGPLYPLSTADSGDFGFHAPTNALAARQLAVKHRRGMGHKTYGKDSLCGGKTEIFMPKEQYKWSQFFPVPEADGPKCCHWTGESQFKTGGFRRQIPAVGEDAVHMLWRYTDCCIH